MTSSSTARKPTRVSVTLDSCDSLVLDLKRGFSSHIGMIIRNDESKPVTLCFPGLQHYKDTYATYDFIEGLHEDVFLFQHGESGESVALDNLKQAHTKTSEPAQIVIDAEHRYCCKFVSRGSDQVKNIGLQAGENYLLRFAHTSQRIKCKFSGPRAETPEPFSVSSEQNDLVDVNCIGGPVKIRVVQDVPIPRFQVSFQFSSRICNMSGSPPFALKFSMKSLEPRPVTVDMGFSPWKSFEGFSTLIKLTDTAIENEVELPYVSFCFDGQLTSTPNDFMEFNEGTEYIREWGFDKGPPGTMSEMDCLQPNRTYVAELVDIGFCCWQYGAKAEVLGIMNDRFQVGGLIQPEIVEAAPTFANIIENIFERDRAGPFVRLPRELRDQSMATSSLRTHLDSSSEQKQE